MRIAPYDTNGNHSFIYSPNKSYRLVIRNDGLLVYQNGDGTDTKPFEIGAGGTGATTVDGARNNLGLGTAQDVQFKSITATDGDILVPQTHIVGCRSGVGGDKRIYLMNIGGDSEPGGWVNLLQGNWHDGYWQLGGVRGEGSDLKTVQLYINPNKSGYSGSNFSFIPEPNDAQASGYVRSPRGFMGRCYMGGWDATADNRLTPFWADTVTKNNTAWSPIVSGGSMSDGGYYMRTSLGIISSSAADWPEVSIHMLGDGRYHRAYSFNKFGGIYSWGNDPWGGNYDFAKNPTSDRDLKHDIQYTDGKESYDRVMQWLPTMFKYNGSDIQRFGLIAQDLLKIDPQYVKLVPGSPVFEDVIGVDENGEEYIDRQIETDREDDTLALDSNVVLTDLACAFRYQADRFNKLEQELTELKKLVSGLIKPDNS
ncbi:tail fiber domain-containing protein [Salmonella enterica]|nr:tail fiber domain-containing protein [Salmonella enterica]